MGMMGVEIAVECYGQPVRMMKLVREKAVAHNPQKEWLQQSEIHCLISALISNERPWVPTGDSLRCKVDVFPLRQWPLRSSDAVNGESKRVPRAMTFFGTSPNHDESTALVCRNPEK